jgi:ATP-dependent DNA ligase
LAHSAKKSKNYGFGALTVSLNTPPMEARLVDKLPPEPGWQFEPKWDGFRCLAFRAGNEVELRAKSGKTLSRFFPDVVATLEALAPDRFVVDGELAVPSGDLLSFDALQARLHPAESRVRKLAAETPAIFILFDFLMTADGVSLVDTPLRDRRAALEDFYASIGHQPQLKLTPFTRDYHQAQRWLNRAGGPLDGIVAKRLDGRYQPGERAMLKVKRMRTADCVVGGFRYEQGSRQVGSLLLGLYNKEGKLDHVGFTSSIADVDRKTLTGQLEAMVAEPGFTGDAPGGPSRWSTERSSSWEPLRPKLVVEVRYDHVTGGRFRHGTKLIRWRYDKAPEQCTFDQIEHEAGPEKLVTETLNRSRTKRTFNRPIG